MKTRYAAARIAQGQVDRATVRDHRDVGAAIQRSQMGIGSTFTT